jgi:hypothetical protein
VKKILIAGAGGAPSEGVINSMNLCTKKDIIIGMGSEPTDLIMSSAKDKYYIPYANSDNYQESLIKVLNTSKPSLVHFQNDLEIFHASKIREEIRKTGTEIFMPDHDVIDTCVHKYKSYLKFKQNGITVPKNILINNEEDLKDSFRELSDLNGNIWLRSTTIGGGGKGALPTNNLEFAKLWIDKYDGWGQFAAAEMLTPNSVTWLSIWYEGRLIVAQTRIRKGWTHGNRSVSGVTGVTKVGQTYSSNEVNEIAMKSIFSVSEKPHGIFGVDMTYDKNGIPNPTEINISRFFTTVLFFTKAGLNMPAIFKNIILYNEFPELENKINPLKDGLLWLRGMDIEPKLMTDDDILQNINYL